MSIKQKILDALDATSLEDIAEDNLLDILLADYAAKRQRIADLERQQTAIQLEVKRNIEQLHEERHRMHTDPTYAAAGEYFFSAHDAYGLPQKFVVRIAGRDVSLLERKTSYDMMVQRVNREDFLK